MEKEPKNYEIAILAKTEDDQTEVAKLISRHQIKIVGEAEQPTRIRLAYPIKKENYAFFGFLHFSAVPQEAQKITKELGLNQKILRFMVISQPEIQSGAPTVVKPIRKISPIRLKAAEPLRPAKKIEPSLILTNEALEKKLEEILK